MRVQEAGKKSEHGSGLKSTYVLANCDSQIANHKLRQIVLVLLPVTRYASRVTELV